VWRDDFRPVNHLGFGQATASPARSENVNFFGAITLEVDTELAKPALAIAEDYWVVCTGTQPYNLWRLTDAGFLTHEQAAIGLRGPQFRTPLAASRRLRPVEAGADRLHQGPGRVRAGRPGRGTSGDRHHAAEGDLRPGGRAGRGGRGGAGPAHLAAPGTGLANGAYYQGLTPAHAAPIVGDRKAVGRLWTLSARLTGLA
jgi:hypothetical protein